MTIRNERGILSDSQYDRWHTGADGMVEAWRLAYRHSQCVRHILLLRTSGILCADLEDGMAVHAGQLLGFTGDSDMEQKVQPGSLPCICT